MILGAANFGNEYRGTRIEKEECFKLLEYFEKNGGKIVQSGDTYGDSQRIITQYIKENNSTLVMLFKINELGLLFIEDQRVGHSIYYPHQLNPLYKLIVIPNSNVFNLYLPIIKLHSKVYARSFFKIPIEHHANKKFIDDYIIGVDNMDQLKINMEMFYV